MKHVCAGCLFVLAFCACTKAESVKVENAVDVAIAVADCVNQVAKKHPGVDLKDPVSDAALVAELSDCAKVLAVKP